MKKTKDRFWSLLRNFFTVYLPKQRGCSEHTISACHKTWNLLLLYLNSEKKIDYEQMTIELFDATLINEFLDYMESKRNWKISTRNQRISCIRIFFNYVAMTDSTLYSCVSNLQSIPKKKDVNKSMIVEFIPEDAITTLLSIPNSSHRLGMRDQFFLSLMYDTAARDSEMLQMKRADLNMEMSSVYLLGKGNKPRLVPISKETLVMAKKYCEIFHVNDKEAPMFYTTHRGYKTLMSDDNVARFLKKYADMARVSNPHVPERIYPHIIRKSRAMHLYRSGMPLALLAEFLGHADPQTTLIYAYADTEMKRNAIEKAASRFSLPNNTEMVWKNDNDIIERLCRGY